MGYVFLVLAALCEVGWATGVKVSAGFSRPGVAAAAVVLYLLSFVAMTMAARWVSITVVYPVWVGLGAVGIAVVGVVWLKEPWNAMKLVSIALIVTGVVGLSLSDRAPIVPPAEVLQP